MKVFGRALKSGSFSWSDGQRSAEVRVERTRGGFKVTGRVRGLSGRLEILRTAAPEELLVNNWQSWGPFQKMRRGERHSGIEDVMKKYSRYVFTPIPETFLRSQVSDYFIVWPGGLAGFLSSRVAHPFFAVEGDEIVGYLEYFGIDFADAIGLEPLVILESEARDSVTAKLSSPDLAGFHLDSSTASLLESYAELAAAENGVRIPARNPVGWSSWYHYFLNLKREDVEKNLRLAREKFPFEVFEIDDSYERDIGDWLETKEGFGKLPDLARLITGEGLSAGVWTAPFSASETSRLFEEHEDWMVHEGGVPKECYKNWGKRIFAPDTTRPEVKDWLAAIFGALKNMGFDYFKIDFLFAAAMPGERARKVTPIQAYREGLKIIREAVGRSFVLGCGAPLLPSLGLVDGLRIGEDTAPHWDASRGPFEGPNAYWALKNSLLRSFMHRRWWLNDPDCLLLRSQDIKLTPNERELYALTAGALDNMIIESDDLELVDEEGRELLRRAISLRGGRIRVTGWPDNDFFLVEARESGAGNIRLLANLSNRSRRLDQTDVPPHSAQLSLNPQSPLR